MTRKAIILSAGQGRRMLPLTEHRPKCLLPLGGRTILEWQIAAQAGSPIAVTVDRKDRYGADDMKVRLDGTRLIAIGKTLPPEHEWCEVDFPRDLPAAERLAKRLWLEQLPDCAPLYSQAP